MNGQIGLKEAWEQLLSYDPIVWVGVFTAIIIFVIEIILHKKNIIFSSDDKRVAKAKEKGHIISATQVKCRYYDKNSGARNYVATYEYEFGGMIHQKKIVTSNSQPPLKIALYYDKNKVFSEYDAGTSSLKVLMYIIPIAVAITVMMAMGFEG